MFSCPPKLSCRIGEAPLNPKELRELSVRIAGEASGLLRDIREDKSVFERIEETSETIVADRESEKYIIDSLRAEGFTGPILSEEIGYRKGEGNITAIIDPLDGSRNYVVGIPWCSVSIAFIDTSSNPPQIVAGTVQPIYSLPPISFYKDGGVYYGEKKMKPKTVYEQKEEPIYAVYEDEPGALQVISRVYEEKRKLGLKPKIRSLGSASLELAYTSIGKFRAFIDARSKLRIVDIAAGLGMIIENKGFYTDIKGAKPKIHYTSLDPIESIVASIYQEEINAIVKANR